MDASRIDYSLLAGAESLRPKRLGVASSTDLDLDTHKLSLPSPLDDSAASSEEEEEEDDDELLALAPGKLQGASRLPSKVSQDPNDWLWLVNEEPHRSRRRAILKAHPEVTKLMGFEPLTKYIVVLVVAIQLLAAFLLRNTSPLSFKFLLAAYAIGGTANQNLFLSVRPIHEITHNLAFKGVKSNRCFAMFANLPIGIPYAMMFKKYHMEALGVDGVDTDLPTRAELLVLRNVAGKAFFCTFQILFYALRPGFVRAQQLTRWHALNAALQLSFDAAVYSLGAHCGLSSPSSSLWYFVLSSFFAGSLHPCAGHFIAEHYLFDQFDQETWSYYGPLNALTYNVGYHNEHHDFPSVPWTRLPRLHALAKEFYDPLPRHTSWCAVTYKFIFHSDVGIFSRAKRVQGTSDQLEDVKHAGGRGDLGGLKDS
ncbi:MAG: hypothetical protein CYPHOPRED_004270 [Cyphobasidiales sp. Tagirdzhanova-0007]|nr:MAG: hypothetical protein CYPHOPRED_004270 [Cyphobasidiales sp. Tagirdzhanova-0007]